MTQPVVLISAPWGSLRYPSIQLGTLKAFLNREGIPCTSRSLAVDWMKCMYAELAAADRFSVDEYERIGNATRFLGLADWAFAFPPVRALSESRDAEYLTLLRGRGASEDFIHKATVARGLVPGFLAGCADRIVGEDPLLVGFSMTFSQNHASLLLAHLIKQRSPETPIVFGGSNCEGPMGLALHRLFPWVDIVVRGPGEEALVSIARALKANRPIQTSVSVLARGFSNEALPAGSHSPEIDLDQLPIPDYDDYFQQIEGAEFYDDVIQGMDLPFETGRGCWWGAKHHCTFCGLNGATMAFRSKSPDRVVSEIRSLSSRYQRRTLAAVDNIIDFRYFDTVLPMLRDDGYDLDIFYEIKGNLTKAQVRLLRDSGIRRIQPGLESLSSPILRLMRKGITAWQNVRLLKWCAEMGVDPEWNLLFGFPGEPPVEYERMVGLIPSLVHLKPPVLARLIVERFSPYHFDAAALGVRLIGPEPLQRYLYDADDEDLTELGYYFEYAYADGRDPEDYVGPLRKAVSTWRDQQGHASLRYFVCPGYVEIVDDRDTTNTVIYALEHWQATTYLECDAGTTPQALLATLSRQGQTVTESALLSFLRDCVERGLIYEDEGKFLSLAVGTGSLGRHGKGAVPVPQPVHMAVPLISA
jgi:ribosomal peptide maturation radical SAM protein 1